MFQPISVPRRRSRLITTVVSLALVAAAGFAAPPPCADAQVVSLDVLTRAGYGAVPLKRPKPNVLIAEATLDGRRLRLIVDTGASASVGAIYLPLFAAGRQKSQAVEMKIEAASGAQLTGNRVGRAQAVRLGNVEMRDVPLVFSNLPTFLRPSTPDGLLGAPFLRACSAVIDLQNLTLYLRPPGQGQKVVLGPGLRGLHMTEVAMNNGWVGVELDGHPGRMFVDTGAYFSSLDSGRAAQMQIRHSSSRWGFEDASGKKRRAERAVLKSFKIGDFVVPAPDILVTPLGSFAHKDDGLGLLGMDVLGRNGAIIDYSQGKLYLLDRR